MMNDDKVNKKRRRLVTITAVAGGAATVASAVPFVASMMPSERAKAAGAPVEYDASKVTPGQMDIVKWRGQPVWVVRRTKEMLESLPQMNPKVSDPSCRNKLQPAYCTAPYRSIKPELLVVVGICSHLGCSPVKKFEPGEASGLGADWLGGFYCPCHGSKFDLAGRVLKNQPAPFNLTVPPHQYLTDDQLLIGEDKKEA